MHNGFSQHCKKPQYSQTVVFHARYIELEEMKTGFQILRFSNTVTSKQTLYCESMWTSIYN